MKQIYPILDAKIFERGIKQSVMASALGITQRALLNKRKGKAPFTWPEVCIIQSRFFPDIDKDTLFQKSSNDQQKGA